MANASPPSPPPLVICFCGADRSWEELVKNGFRRRHSCLLREWTRHPDVERIFVISNVTRATYFHMLRRPKTGREFANGKVVDVYVAQMFPERAWLPGSAVLNRFIKRRQARRQIGNLSARPPVVWCYWPRGLQQACDLNLPGHWVFDADHNIVDDPNLEPGERTAMEGLLRRCAGLIAVAVAASRSMLTWFRQNGGGRTEYLRNGVDLSRFDGLPSSNGEGEPRARPRIGFVGTLSRWVNYELLATLAKRRPDWDFILAGPAFKKSESFGLEQLPNVTFLGARSDAEVPPLMATFDVGLVPYKSEPSLDGDSMKIFEYLAVGVPVVAAPLHAELQSNFCGLLNLADGPEEFEAAIENLLAKPRSTIGGWKQKCREFLQANTWSVRAGEAVRLMQGLGPRNN